MNMKKNVGVRFSSDLCMGKQFIEARNKKIGYYVTSLGVSKAKVYTPPSVVASTLSSQPRGAGFESRTRRGK